jgi:DNA-binding LacI/PurR family transcriptional regulator
MAQQYGYQPNAIARSLNNRQSRLVAVVVNAIGNQCEVDALVCGNDVMAIGARDAAIRLLNRHVRAIWLSSVKMASR